MQELIISVANDVSACLGLTAGIVFWWLVVREIFG